MTRTIVRAARVAEVNGTADPVTIVVEHGRIDAIVSGHADAGLLPVVGDGSQSVAAGLIDIHTHGAIGVQTIDGDVSSLRRLSTFYAAHGVTGFLGTIGGSQSNIELGLEGLTRFMDTSAPGAVCLGIHLEGPFLNCCQPGAFNVASIVAPDVRTFERYCELAGGRLRLMTVAPEVDGQLAVIAAARRAGVICSAGHSAASDTEMLEMIEHGVTSITHMFNAMPQLHHRSPGLVGVGLTDRRIVTELIADGVHVAPRVVQLLASAKGWEGIALVSDSIAGAGLDDGVYGFEEQVIHLVDGQARLADGTLAGSTLTLDAAV
ncbi:MAG: amidohydrolase family protein [Ilumatobacter sp.]